MSGCPIQASGRVDLYFYGELDATARADVQHHLEVCGECQAAVEELSLIRTVLARRPDVCAPAGGDWSPFMARLNGALEQPSIARASPLRRANRHRLAGHLAMAALLTLVTSSVAYVALHRPPSARAGVSGAPVAAPPAPSPTASSDDGTAAFIALSERHFERSKLVVLGLSSKDARATSASDWAYERQLAASLLDDTRLYRRVAEERGLASVARVMSDLELVLLQVSLSDTRDADTLERIQRLIRKRDLVTKMNVVASAGM
jgi:putative zinc finger protein